MKRILHAMLRVRDLPAMLHFYCDVLGMRERRRISFETEQYTVVFIGYDEGAEIELWHDWSPAAAAAAHGSSGHVGIGVADIHGLCAALVAAGVRLTRAPAAMRQGGRVIALLRDPEGYEVELLSDG